MSERLSDERKAELRMLAAGAATDILSGADLLALLDELDAMRGLREALQKVMTVREHNRWSNAGQWGFSGGIAELDAKCGVPEDIAAGRAALAGAGTGK